MLSVGDRTLATSSKKTITLLVVAIGLGVLGAFLAMLYLNARESSLRDLLKPKSELVAVVVASKDLLKGDVLDGNTLSIREIPAAYVDNNAIRPGQFDAIEGKILQQNLAVGKMLLASYVGADFPLDFSDTLTIKRRAMTIQVDEMSTFTGLLRPGNRIDLFVNISIGDAQQKSIMPVLENVEVLTTGRDSAYDYTEKVRFLRGGVNPGINQNFTTVTLNVTAKEAAILASAQDKGDLLVLLRNRKDKSGSGFSVISSNQVLANAKRLERKEQLRRSTEKLSDNVVLGKDGVLRNKEGVALSNQNLLIAADGTIRTKSGINLSSRGLSLNAKGEIVDKDGNVIDPDSLVIAADGSLMTSDGRLLDGEKVQSLAGAKVKNISGATPLNIGGAKQLNTVGAKQLNLAGAKQQADGSVMLADGTIIKDATIDSEGNLVMADGSVITADSVMLADGTILKDASVDSDGNIVMADGSVITANSVMLADGTILKDATLDSEGNLVMADGSVITENSVMLADGTIINDATLDSAGNIVTADGSVISANSVVLADGSVINGATLDSDGNLVMADGTVIKAEDVVINADGTVSDRNGNLLAGLSVSKSSRTKKVSDVLPVGASVDYLAGGISKDGILTVQKLPVAK